MTKILIRYNEIYLKGHNRGMFERMLVSNIKTQLSGFDFVVRRISGRVIVEGYEQNQQSKILNKLQKVAGIFSMSVAEVVKTDYSAICDKSAEYVKPGKSFRVTAKRADKRFPFNSCEIASKVGGYILSCYPDLKVDLHTPDIEICLEIREDGNTYVYAGSIACQGGLPVGCSGKGLVMLSGGIDSPVAAYMMAKRGMSICGLHFHSYPYTSEQAKEKVVSLASILKEYSLKMNLYVVPFTEVQDSIHNCCKEEFMVILMRRMMMRIANFACAKYNCQTIITGENLAQVASQTIESITVTNMIAEYPVLRPVIGFDKSEIIELAKKIDTYETSILPYEDCCTVFLPERPIIKPKLYQVLAEEAKLDIDTLVANAVNNIEMIEV